MHGIREPRRVFTHFRRSDHAAWNCPINDFAFKKTFGDCGEPGDSNALELGRYNVRESDLRLGHHVKDCSARTRLLHAHKYEPASPAWIYCRSQPYGRRRKRLPGSQKSLRTKLCNDAREKAIRDREWEIDAAIRKGKIEGKIEGEIKGEIKMIRTLQGLAGVPAADEAELRTLTLEELQTLTNDLQEKFRNRTPA